MDNLLYLPEYRLAVCRKCGYAILGSHCEAHFGGGAHRLSVAQRRQIKETIQSWDIRSTPQEALTISQELRYRDEPLLGISISKSGIKCQLGSVEDPCDYICQTIRGIKNHCKNIHGWTNTWARGPGKAVRQIEGLSIDRPWQENVRCQRLFPQRCWLVWFEIGPENVHPSEEIDAQPERALLLRSRIENDWQRVEDDRNRTIAEGERDELTPWLRRTRWLLYLDGFQRETLLTLTQRPKEDEFLLAKMCAIIKSLLHYCQYTVRMEMGPMVGLEAVRVWKHQTKSTPLTPYICDERADQYIRYWQQIVLALVRIHRATRTDQSNYPPIRLSEHQKSMLAIFRSEAHRAMHEDDERGGEQLPTDSIDDAEPPEAVDDAISEDVEPPEAVDDATSLPEEAREPLDAAQRACLHFCISLLDQRMKGHDEYELPFVGALALLGVDRRQPGWHTERTYPSILSGVLKMSRYLVVQQAFEASREARGQGCIDQITEYMDRFMIRGTYGPMQWMLDLNAYGLKVLFRGTEAGHIQWTEDNLMIYKKIELKIPTEISGLVHSLVAQARTLLVQQLLMATEKDLPPIDWNSLRDQPTTREPGWSFICDPRNRMDDRWWLFNRITRSSVLTKRFVLADGTWCRRAVDGWMGTIRVFREKLLVLMHLCGGQPGRGPEVLSIRHQNTVVGGPRNLFIEDGLVVYVTLYHKNFSRSGEHRVIQRYLPQEVGELIVRYLWLVLPLFERFLVSVYGRTKLSSHLWTMEANGTKWTAKRMARVLQETSTSLLGQTFGIAAWREIAIAISRRFMQGGTAFVWDELDFDEGDDEEGAIEDRQAAHSRQAAERVYARLMDERDGELGAMRRKFRRSSCEWHAVVLQFASALERPHPSQKRKRAQTESMQLERFQQLRRADLLHGLRLMRGNETASFRGIQEVALQAIVRGEGPVVAIMPTGGGKSLLFMLPAFCARSGTTVVIVPLLALRSDLRDRIRGVGISCAVWNPQRQPEGARIVLTTPEAGLTEAFGLFLRRIRERGELDRIVIDECHIALHEQWDFRRKLMQIKEFGGLGTQMILLTATLPPQEEGRLWARMEWEAADVVLFRMATSRTNIRYVVIDFDSLLQMDETGEQRCSAEEREFSAIQKLLYRRLRRLGSGKAVLYCNTVRRTKRLGDTLGCESFYHDAPDREEILERFREAGDRIIVATSAFGLGVDITDIRLIIHVDEPRSLLEYGQESGRAGRDASLTAEALMLKRSQWDSMENVIGRDRLVKALWKGECCIRVSLDSYLDGNSLRTGCEAGEEACSQCQPDATMPYGRDGTTGRARTFSGYSIDSGQRLFEGQHMKQRRLTQRLVDGRQQAMAELAEVRTMLEAMRGLCPFCTLLGTWRNRHSLFWCREVGVAPAVRLYKEILQTLRVEKRLATFSGCTLCFVPQEWCNGWEENTDRKKEMEVDGAGGWQKRADGSCQYRDVVLSGFVVWMLHGSVVGQLSSAFTERALASGFEVGENAAELGAYLGQRMDWGGQECNRLFWEFWQMGRALRILEGLRESEVAQ